MLLVHEENILLQDNVLIFLFKLKVLTNLTGSKVRRDEGRLVPPFVACSWLKGLWATIPLPVSFNEFLLKTGRKNELIHLDGHKKIQYTKSFS